MPSLEFVLIYIWLINVVSNSWQGSRFSERSTTGSNRVGSGPTVRFESGRFGLVSFGSDRIGSDRVGSVRGSILLISLRTITDWTRARAIVSRPVLTLFFFRIALSYGFD